MALRSGAVVGTARMARAMVRVGVGGLTGFGRAFGSRHGAKAHAHRPIDDCVRHLRGPATPLPRRGYEPDATPPHPCGVMFRPVRFVLASGTIAAGSRVTDRQSRADSVTSRTVIGASWMMAWRMVTRGLGLISTLVLARLLVPADFGLVATATSLAAAIDSMSQLGLVAALVRHAKADRGLYDTAFTLQLIRGTLTAAVVAAGAWWAADWFGDARLFAVLLVLAGGAIVAGLENIAIVAFERDLRFDIEFRLLLLPRLLQFAVTMTLAFTLHSYWALVLGGAVGRVARTAFTYRLQPHRPRLTLSHWQELASFSFWSWAGSLAYLVWNRCDTFILGPALGMAKLGIFLLSAEIGLLPTTEVMEPASRALYAGVAAVRNRGADGIGMALSVTSTLLMFVMPISIGISATSGFIVAGLLGPNWVSGRPVIAMFALLSVLTPISFVASTILNSSGHIRANFWVMLRAALFRCLAVYMAARYGQIDLVAVAVGGALLMEASLFLRELAKHGRLNWRASVPGLLRTIACNLTMAAAAWASGMTWRPVELGSVQALLVGGTIGLACIAVSWGMQTALWFALGRPAGPEATLIRVATTFTDRWRLTPAR